MVEENSPKASKEYYGLMKEVCGDNNHAYDFVVQACGAALHFDHVWDGDEVDKEMSQKVLEALVLYWPLNPFIRANAPYLVSSMSHGLELWRSGEDEYAIYNCIASATCFAIGGQPLVDATMPNIRYITKQGQMEDDLKDGQSR